jgi:hypothetical protein
MDGLVCLLAWGYSLKIIRKVLGRKDRQAKGNHDSYRCRSGQAPSEGKVLVSQ